MKYNNSVTKCCIIYISRMNMANELVFLAGTKDKDDLYSKGEGVDEWQ
jgi:hypothetical protein